MYLKHHVIVTFKDYGSLKDISFIALLLHSHSHDSFVTTGGRKHVRTIYCSFI